MFKADNLTKTKILGITSGFFSPLFYTIDSVLDILLFGILFGIGYKDNLGFATIFLYSVITSMFKDFSLFIYILIKTNTKFWDGLKWFRQKSFWLTVFGTICGGPLGFTLTTASILYNGASYGAVLTNFSPIIVLLLARKYLRTKINLWGWTGVFLVIASFTALAIIKTNDFSFNLHSIVGILIAVSAVLTWSMETFFAEYVEKMGNQALNIDQKLIIKSTTSTLFLSFILLPIAYGLVYLTNSQVEANNTLAVIFQNWQGPIILTCIGILVTLGRVSYWYSISHAGGARADILYYLTVIFVPITSICLSLLNVPGFQNFDGGQTWYFWLLLFTQVSGIFLIVLTTDNKHFTFEKYSKNYNQ